MTREDITYAVVGIVAGLVLGFFVANWSGAGTDAGSQAAGSAAQAPASVNSNSQAQDLPPGHPPIDSSQPMSAPPLPAGAESRNSSAAADESSELPSLDPLPASSREQRTEQKYKNIQMLKGLPAERLESIMFAFKSSLGVECTYCHIKDHFDKDDKPTKQMARKMIALTRNANNQLGGAARVTCFTCHRGQTRPPA